MQSRFISDYQDHLIDAEPRWTTGFTDELDLDLDILTAFEDMAYPGFGSGQQYAPRPILPCSRPSLPSLDMTFPGSRIPAPTAWGNSPGQNPRDDILNAPFHLDVPALAPGCKEGTHARNNSGASHELDALSTISPMSPRTPGARSDSDVNVHPASPYQSVAARTPAYYPRHQFPDMKREIHHCGYEANSVSPRELHLEPDENFPQLQEMQGSHGTHPPYNTWSAPDSYGIHHSGGDYPVHTEQQTAEPSFYRQPDATVQDEDNASMRDAEGDSEDDYHPGPSTRQTDKSSRSVPSQGPPRRGNVDPTKAIHTSRITKRRNPPSLPSSTTHSPASSKTCPDCPQTFPSATALEKHIKSTHTRPFTCLFARYGCTHRFGSKNEWARHIRVQHLHLEIWTCDIGKCGRNPGSQLHHSFDRKDLFTQHVRRMHPGELPRDAGEGEGDLAAQKAGVEARIQQRCHGVVRLAPAGLRCLLCPTSSPSSSSTSATPPSPSPQHTTFADLTAYLEHMGKHLETASRSPARAHGSPVEDLERALLAPETEDLGLKQWLHDEGLLTWTQAAGWKVVGCEGKKMGGGGGGGRSARKRGARRGQGKRTKRAVSLDDEGDGDELWR